MKMSETRHHTWRNSHRSHCANLTKNSPGNIGGHYVIERYLTTVRAVRAIARCLMLQDPIFFNAETHRSIQLLATAWSNTGAASAMYSLLSSLFVNKLPARTLQFQRPAPFLFVVKQINIREGLFTLLVFSGLYQS